MGMPSFRSHSEVIPALPDGADQALTHAPAAVSITPVLAGLLIMGLGLFFTSASYNNPFIVLADAPGVTMRGGAESGSVPFPAGIDGKIDVYARGENVRSDALLEDESEQRAGIVAGEVPSDRMIFTVTDSDGELVDPVAYTKLSRFEDGPDGDRYRQVAAVDVAPDDDYRLTVDGGWVGRVAFLDDDHPPTDPNWLPVIQGLVVSFLGATLALIWGVRRVRWRVRMKRYRAELAAAGRLT